MGSYLTLNAVQRMGLRLRMDVLRHVDQLSADYYENTPPGAVMYPLKEPIEEVALFGSDLLPSILRMCLTTGFTIVTMFVLSPKLTFAILPLLPVFLVALAALPDEALGGLRYRAGEPSCVEQFS